MIDRHPSLFLYPLVLTFQSVAIIAPLAWGENIRDAYRRSPVTF